MKAEKRRERKRAFSSGVFFCFPGCIASGRRHLCRPARGYPHVPDFSAGNCLSEKFVRSATGSRVDDPGFPDALHPLGGKCRPARGCRQQSCVFREATGLSLRMFLLPFSLKLQRETVCSKIQSYSAAGSRDNVPGSGFGAE